jgi:hypothetical protein
MDDGTILVYGFNEKSDYPLGPFFLTVAEDGSILSQEIYWGYYQSTPKNFLRYLPDDLKASLGNLSLSGDLPGTPYIYDFAVLPNGDTTLIGFFSDTFVSGDGGSFSTLTGIWAVRFDKENKIIWQRFFKSRFGPWFFGSILPNGSVVLLKNSSYTYDSILKLDPNGYTEYWKHFTSIGTYAYQTVKNDGGIILIGTQSHLLELDSRGEIIQSILFTSDEDSIIPKYAYETRDGDLILAANSDLHGAIISRFNISSPIPDCPQLSFMDHPLEEYSPLLPYNISSSVKVKVHTTDLEELKDIEISISLEESSADLSELCRYRDPEPVLDQ